MSTKEQPSLQKRYLGTLLGLACGDAVGTAVEFAPRGSFEPVTDMVGGGPFGLKAGQWTDDTSMALCLAESLINKKEFNAHDQMNRYLNWWRWGYLSSTGHCFDIGMTTRDALFDFERNQNSFSGSPDPSTAGNGSLMRLAPVVLFGFNQKLILPQLAADSSRTTHGAAEAIESCQLLAELIHGALNGTTKVDLLDSIEQRFYEPKVHQLACGEFKEKTHEQIKG